MRVLLREPELCPMCRGVFLSLYPLKRYDEHDGLEDVMSPPLRPAGDGKK